MPMQLITRTPTRTYFITIFVIVSALFFIFSGVIYYNYREAQRLNAWTLYNYELARQGRRILFELINMESGVRGYLLTGRTKFLEPYQHSQKNLHNQITAMAVYTRDDLGAQENVDHWLKQIEEFAQTLDTQVESYKTGHQRSISQPQMERQKKQMDALRVSLEGFVQERLQDLQDKIAKSKEAQKNFKYILGIGTVLAIAGMLLATLVILNLLQRNQRAEQSAIDMEDRFKAVMVGVNDGLYDRNLLNDEIYYSPSYKSMLGYTDEEFPNTVTMSTDNIHQDDYAQVQEVLSRYIAGESPSYRNVFRMLHKDGYWVWILSRGIGFRDANGRMTRIIGTHTDITEQKKREEELTMLNSEMETFTYITSHDLRAPLVNLKGFAGEMAHAVHRVMPIMQRIHDKIDPEDREVMRQVAEEDIPESLKFIEQSVAKMDALTTAVLDLSRIGKREYKYERVDTPAVVQRCLDTQAYEIGQKGIRVQVGDLPIITSDPLALEQVFSNIIDNAIKYLDPTRHGEIDIFARSKGNDIVFTIADNGRGILDADRDKVFQIFRRARNSADVRGIGMGMAFVQATIRRLGGTIWFSSEPGIGTSFSFTIPKHPRMKGTPL